MKKIPLTETQIKKQILEYLTFARILHWRQNTGASIYPGKEGNDRFVRYGVAGMSDIMALQTSFFYAFEVKNEKEYAYLIKHYDQIKKKPQSKKQWKLLFQIQFIENVQDEGHIGKFVCSLEQVKNVIENRPETLKVL